MNMKETSISATNKTHVRIQATVANHDEWYGHADNH